MISTLTNGIYRTGGTEMYKVNNKIEDSIRVIKEVLLSDEALFRFDVITEGTAMLLTIQKESKKLEYRTYGNTKYQKMKIFLMKLRKVVPNTSEDDIDFLLDEMEVQFNYASHY